MKIVCPECQAAYEIDVPDSPSKNLSAKCAVCDTKFPIKKRSLAESNHAHDSMTGPPLAQIDSGLAEESGDDFLSGLQEDLKSIEGLNFPDEESTDEKDLDDYLDQLMEEESSEAGEETADEAEPQPAENLSPSTFEMPSEEDLDHLFDSLIADEIKSPEKEEDIADSQTDQEDEDVDALLDEIIQNNLDEEGEPKTGFDATESISKDSEPPAEEIEEVDAPVSDALEDTQEIETPEPENVSAETIDAESSAEDEILAEVLSEENLSSESDSIEDSKEISEDPEATGDTETAAEQQEEEKSDEDLWAEAFADQDANKDNDDTETAAEPQEDEKSDEDLWAEAFADQEAKQDNDDTETAAEQQEDEKSDEDGDPKEESVEMPEAVDPGGEEGAEETVEAEAITNSEEDDEPEEEEETSVFGISESDYDDDNYDEEFSPPAKKKSAFFVVPSTKTGKLILAGGVLAVLLTGGGAYFALQTLAPPELTQMAKKSSEVPEGLQPKDIQKKNQQENASAPTEKPNPRALSRPRGKFPTSFCKGHEKFQCRQPFFGSRKPFRCQ